MSWFGASARRHVQVFAAELLLCGLVLLSLASSPGSAAAASRAEQVAARQRAKISMKVLSFEASTKERAGDGIVIGVVYKASSSRSTEAATTMVAAYNALGTKHTLYKKRVSAVAIPYDDGLSRAVSAARVAMLYVAPGLSGEIYGIAAIAADKRLPTMCGSRRQLELGLAFAIIAKGGRPAIVVKLSAATSIGLRLDPRLLRLAEVIK